MSSKPEAASIGMLFAIGFAFGLTFIFNRLATTNGVPFVPYVLWQAVGGTMILLCACAVYGQMPALSPRYLKLYVVTGTINVSLPICVLSFVAPKVPAGILSLGLVLIPILIYCFALALGMDSFHWVRLAGILLGFGGVLLVLLPKTSLPSPDLTGWVLVGLLAPLCYALGAIFMARLAPPDSKSLPLACGLLSASAVTMFVVMLGSGTRWFFTGQFDKGELAVIGAGINQAAIFVLMFEIIKREGPVFFSTSNYIATLLGVTFGILFFGDSHSWWVWAAMSLMFIGLYCVNVSGVGKRELASG
jgi:drug/metabolite transporter (DMT)-like permease